MNSHGRQNSDVRRACLNLGNSGWAGSAPTGLGVNDDDRAIYPLLIEQSDVAYATSDCSPLLSPSTEEWLHRLTPNSTLIEEASEKCNRASYMILYRSPGGKILIPGDAEDSTWEFVLEHYSEHVRDCSILGAPHHGRHSDMDFSYRKTVNPKLVLMGCASSKDLAYDAFRDYWRITNNQAGNVVAECDSAGINIFVENETFAKVCGVDVANRNDQGYVFLGRI